MYKNQALIKSFLGSAAMLPYTVVKFGADDNTVSPATAVGDLLIGVINEIGHTAADVTNGSLCSITVSGIAELKLGGTVTRGQRLTINASGQGVNAAPAAGSNNQIIGLALKSGVAGDIIPVLLSPSVMQG